MPKIIAFTGRMGSGKTTASDYLVMSLRSAKVIKLAQPIYDIQSFINTKLGYNRLAKHKFRPVMQFIGQWARGLDKDCWINIWRDTYEAYDLTGIYSTIIVDDLRFDNEAEMLKELGATIIRLDATDNKIGQRIVVAGELHESEKGISDSYVDYYVNNSSSVKRLHKQLEFLIAEIGLK